MSQQKYVAWPTGQKEEALVWVEARRLADEVAPTGWIIKCVLGELECSSLLGVSPEISRIIGEIYDGLPLKLALDWPSRVVRVLRPGADTTMVWPKFAVWLLTEVAPSQEGEVVAELYKRKIAGDEPSAEEWQKAGLIFWPEATRTHTVAACAAMSGVSKIAADRVKNARFATTQAISRTASWYRAAAKLEEILEACPNAGTW